MPFGLYGLANKLGLPDLGISEALTGYHTPSQMSQWIPDAQYVQQQQQQGYQQPIGPTYQAPTYKQPTYVAPKTNYVAPKTGAVQPVTKITSKNVPTVDPMAQQNSYIDQNYQNAIDALNQQYGNAQQSYGNNQNYLNDLYNGQTAQLGTARQSALDTNQQNRLINEQSQQGAIDLANKTYGELQQKNQQMYGGVSSAGQFGSEIQGRALQQGVNEATQTGQSNLAALMQNANDIESNYTQGVKDLNLQKSKALSDLDAQFRDVTAQIDQQKGGINSNKAMDKYNALKEYNSQQQQIQSQWSDYMLQMNQNAAAAKTQLAASMAQYQAQLGQQPDLNSINQIPFPDYTPTQDPNTGEMIYPTVKKKTYAY